MGIYVAGVFVVSFLCFFLVAEQLNPFSKPNSHVRRSQWRYGRRVGAAALGAGAILIILKQWTQLASPPAMALCSVLFGVSWFLIARHAKYNELY